MRNKILILISIFVISVNSQLYGNNLPVTDRLDIVDVIKYRRSCLGLDEIDSVVIDFGRQLMGARNVKPETFAKAHKMFGTRMLIDIVSVMGSYAATGALLTAFDIQLHPDKEPLLPLD